MPVYGRDRRRALQVERPPRARQDKYGRVRHGLVRRRTRVRPTEESMGPDARFPEDPVAARRRRLQLGLAPWALGSRYGWLDLQRSTTVAS